MKWDASFICRAQRCEPARGVQRLHENVLDQHALLLRYVGSVSPSLGGEGGLPANSNLSPRFMGRAGMRCSFHRPVATTSTTRLFPALVAPFFSNRHGSGVIAAFPVGPSQVANRKSKT